MTLPLLLALLATALPGQGEPPSPPADCRLNDVWFLNARQGWAVGDRGAILHTDDGGQHWRWQASGVSCRLRTVCFLNNKLGWAAGGFSQPYAHTSVGVVLVTRDGGHTWTKSAKLLLPAVRRLGFFDPQHGWAVTYSSAMYPSGVFVSNNAGRTWQPVMGGRSPGWQTGDFADASAGAVVGRDGWQGIVRGGEIDALQAEGLGLRTGLQLRLIDPRHGWLVGQGGMARTTADGGLTWRPPQAALPGSAGMFDFTALAVRGPKCWLAGSPGSRVFYTGDGGRSWSAFASGNFAPLRAITFADDQHGWAVGDLGTILASSDGGRNWQCQCSGGARAAVLGLFGDPVEVPWELFARLGGEEAYLSALEVLGRRDLEAHPRQDVPLPDRLQEAMVGVGGASAGRAWQFPLRQTGLRLGAGQILSTWDRVHAGHGLESLESHLIGLICTWRPEVIVTVADDARRPEDEPLDSLLRQALTRAAAKAAGGHAWPPGFREAGLMPWQVKRVYGVLAPESRGAIELPTTQLAPRLGGTLADAAAGSRGLVQDQPAVAPACWAFRLLTGEAGGEQSRRDLLAGIPLPRGGEARRPASPGSSEVFRAGARLVQKRGYIQAILERSQRMGWSAEQLLAQTNQLTRELDDASAGRIVYQLGDRYRCTGRWALAAETFQAMVDRYPDHALTPQALLWLVQFYASEEAAWRVEPDPSRRQSRYQRALTLAKQLERLQPEWFAEPRLQFPLAVAFRNLNRPRQAENCYLLEARNGQRDAWGMCAEGELRRAGSKAAWLKPALLCVRTQSRPHLDGRLEDAVWKRAKRVALESPQHDDDQWPAEVMLAYDAEFLYFAGRCVRAGGPSPETLPAGGPRPRDADLSAHDRVELLLDLDRDRTTFAQLTIDDRGWTNDRWWDDATWNPTWYVAATQTKEAWTFEAAIPFQQLAGRPPRPGDRWAVGVQRILPGTGFQSWSSPAAVAPLPEGFGYLIFE